MTLPSKSQEPLESQTVSVQGTIAGIRISKRMEAELLKIDKMGFLEKGTGEHQSNQVFNKNGVCPCVYAGVWKEPFKILE